MADDTHIFNIPTPISMERLKLETSNLVYVSTTRSNFEPCKNQVIGDVTQFRTSDDLDFKFTDPYEYLSNG